MRTHSRSPPPPSTCSPRSFVTYVEYKKWVLHNPQVLCFFNSLSECVGNLLDSIGEQGRSNLARMSVAAPKSSAGAFSGVSSGGGGGLGERSLVEKSVGRVLKSVGFAPSVDGNSATKLETQSDAFANAERSVAKFVREGVDSFTKKQREAADLNA